MWSELSLPPTANSMVEVEPETLAGVYLGFRMALLSIAWEAE